MCHPQLNVLYRQKIYIKVINILTLYSLIIRRNGWNARPDRLHIVFCVQKAESLLWASPAIDQLIEDAWASPRPDKLEIRLHVTRPDPAARRDDAFSPVR